LVYTVLLGGIAATAFVYWRSQATFDYSGMEIQPIAPLDAATLDPQKLTESISQIVADLSGSLEQIEDEAGARMTEPAIEAATASVVALSLERIPESVQTECLANVKPTVEGLMQVLKRQYKIPGVQAILEPMVSPMLSRLQAFAQIEVD
jgi:hypothetical protein